MKNLKPLEPHVAIHYACLGIQPKPASLYYLVHLAIILVKDLPNVANTIVQQIECKIINVHSICII